MFTLIAEMNMQRVGHGFTSTANAPAAEMIAPNHHFGPVAEVKPSVRLDYLFPDLAANPSSCLPEAPETLVNLARLGLAMRDVDADTAFDSNIPSAYTYLGQFIDHDINFSTTQPPGLANPCLLAEPGVKPWTTSAVLAQVINQRAAVLNLDCLYGGKPGEPRPPQAGNFMAIGKVSKFHDRPDGKDDDNDLLRQKMSADPKNDRVALIGDPRNDQNLMISQLHVAFLRAHNAIVGRGHSYKEAKILLRQHYHWLIIHDYLKKQVADPTIVESVLTSTTPTYNPTPADLWLPLEFSVAAFRFGHTMIRNTYYLNRNFVAGGIPLEMLLTQTALANNVRPTPGKGFPNLPENRIIEWRRFLRGGDNAARRLDTRLSKALFNLLDEHETPVKCESSLAGLDLKRGYVLRIPTGQALAKALELPFLTPSEIEAVVESDGNSAQRGVLASGFAGGTPLWFYILAEAVAYKKQRLGPLGSRLVAEVLIGLVRQSEQSILDPKLNPAWRPTLGTVPGEFNLPDLLQLAGVLEAPNPTN
jgi:Animal haem peroxidase